jgi:hypothetical protein
MAAKGSALLLSLVWGAFLFDRITTGLFNTDSPIHPGQSTGFMLLGLLLMAGMLTGCFVFLFRKSYGAAVLLSSSLGFLMYVHFTGFLILTLMNLIPVFLAVINHFVKKIEITA